MRAQRICVERGIYYVIVRAVPGRALFDQKEDYLCFLARLAKGTASTAFRKRRYCVYALCLLPREAHLLLRVGRAQTARQILQSFLHDYAYRINRTRRRSGALFIPRARSALVELRELRDVICHIHRLPLARRVCTDLERFCWSSHAVYAGSKHSTLVRRAPMSSARGLTRQTRAAIYRAYLRNSRPFVTLAYGMRRARRGKPRVLLRAPIEVFSRGARLRARRRRANIEALRRIIAYVCATMSVSPEALRSPSRVRKLSLARALVAHHAKQQGVATLQQVARYFNRVCSTLSTGVGRYSRRHRALFRTRLPKHILNDLSR